MERFAAWRVSALLWRAAHLIHVAAAVERQLAGQREVGFAGIHGADFPVEVPPGDPIMQQHSKHPPIGDRRLPGAANCIQQDVELGGFLFYEQPQYLESLSSARYAQFSRIAPQSQRVPHTKTRAFGYLRKELSVVELR